MAVTIALLLGAYFYEWVLPGYSTLANTPAPELSLATSPDALKSFARGLNNSQTPNALDACTYAHRSVGLVFAVFFGAAVAGVSWSTPLSKPLRVLLTVLPLAFCAVCAAIIFSVDAALTAEPYSPGALPVLLPASWMFLGLSTLFLIIQAGRAIGQAVTALITGGNARP